MCIYMYVHIYIYVYIYAAVSNGKQKTKAQAILLNLYRLLIVQTKICRLSVCLRRNKQKIPFCNQTKRTDWARPSMHIGYFS